MRPVLRLLHAPEDARPPAPAKRRPLAAVGAIGLGGDALPVAAAARRRPSWRALSFLIVVVLPIALAAEYYFAIAAEQYVAEFRFTLSTAEAPRLDPMALLAGAPAPSPAALESEILVQYIASRAIIDAVDPALDLRRLFAPPQADWWSRLHLPATIEELARYWRGQVDPFYDPANGTVTVRVRAFAPPDALRLAKAIGAAGERLVNELSLRVRRDAVAQAERELAQAEARLAAALDAIRAFRDRRGLIDPAKAAEANGLLATRLRQELIDANAKLATLKTYMRDAAPPVRVLRARIRALAAQQRLLARETTGADAAHSAALSRDLDSYERLQSKQKFAETAYQLALQRLNEARADADRQHVFVASFIPPSLPEEALYPRRWRALGVVALTAFAFWGIGGLTVQSVRDHLS